MRWHKDTPFIFTHTRKISIFSFFYYKKDVQTSRILYKSKLIIKFICHNFKSDKKISKLFNRKEDRCIVKEWEWQERRTNKILQMSRIHDCLRMKHVHVKRCNLIKSYSVLVNSCTLISGCLNEKKRKRGREREK